MTEQLITEFTQDEPLVLIIGDLSSLRDLFQAGIEESNIKSQSIEPQKIQQNSSLVKAAYKIVWIVSAQSTAQEIEQVGDVLKLFQDRLTVVLPVLQSCIIENGGFESLSDEILTQEKQIQACNKILSDAFFVFGLELLQSTVGRSIIPYLSGSVSDKFTLFDPKITVGVLSENQLVAEIISQMFRPGLKQSILVGNFNSTTSKTLHEIAKQYQSYHEKPIAVEIVVAQTEKIIPFTVKKVSATSGADSLTAYIRSLPSPQAKPVIKSEIKEPVVAPVIVKSPESLKIMETPQSQVSPTLSTKPPLSLRHTPLSSTVVSKELTTPPVIPESIPKIASTPPATVTATTKTITLDEILNTKKPEKTQEKRRDFEPKPNPLPSISKEELSKEVQQIFSVTRAESKTARIQEVVKKEVKQSKKSKRRTALFYGGILVFGVGMGILALIGLFFGSQWYLKQSLIAVIEAHAEERLITDAEWNQVERAAKLTTLQTESYGALFDSEFLNSSTTLLTFSTNLLATQDLHEKAESSAKQAFMGAFGGMTSNTGKLAENIATEARKTYENISQIQATLEQIELTDSAETQLVVIEKFEKQIGEIRKQLAVQQQFLPIVGWLSGEEGKKTYAILLQNNQELRPTGGFIQAVALITFEDGTVINTQVFSANEIDEKVIGQLTPPDDVATYLGENKWYFRDSNWDADFPTSATTIAWFMDESLNVQIDGVVALNLNSLTGLLRAMGPVDIPEYNEVLTHQNLNELMEFHSEVVLIDQNRVEDYSSIVLKHLIQQFTTLPENKALPVMSALFSALDEHELLFTVISNEYDSTLETLGWNGSLKHPNCPPQLRDTNCFVDSIAQVDTNIGVNKANYYLERTVVHDVHVAGAVAQHSREILLKNTADSNAWPKGPYQAYLRFYASPTMQLDSVSINGNTVDLETISERDEHGFKVIGFKVEVPTQSESIILLSYHVPLSVGEESTFAYAFFEQKQSGLQNDENLVRITHDPELTPVVIAPQATVLGEQIVFDTSDNSHIFVGAQFAK
ncbi:MAG: DUF4012 domain-containing protein [Microgenomates group bacterium]